MRSLAPVKYANCFASNGGPIDSLEESKIQFGDVTWSVANARLRPGLRTDDSLNILFASMDGTGLDRNPLVARHKAISEALERWAHHVSSSGPDRDRFGFAADPTSNGMAAFPGWFARQARSFALAEAIERYTIVAWWSGLLPIVRCPGIQSGKAEFTECFRILHPFAKHEVALVRREFKQGFVAYGFAGSRSWSQACESATLELERCGVLLERYYQQNPGLEVGDLDTVQDFMEQRILYFSLPEGAEQFEHQVEQSEGLELKLQRPEVLFDGEIRGPWSRYATVWRVCFSMPSDVFLDKNPCFFYW